MASARAPWRALWGLLLFVAAGWAGAVDAGRAPSRVVSLDLCTDWMVARHLPANHVAALSPMHRRYPVEWVDDRMPVHDGTLEQILARRPDLVITGQYNALTLRQRLQSLGVRVVVLPLPLSLADVARYEQAFLSAVGLPQALARQPLPQAQPGVEARPRLLLLGANAIGTGRGTLEHDVISQAGWDNAMSQKGHAVLDLEHLIRVPPDAILWAAPGHAAQANRFGQHPVLRQLVPAARWRSSDYWPWQCPGPWTWDLIEQLTSWRNELH